MVRTLAMLTLLMTLSLGQTGESAVTTPAEAMRGLVHIIKDEKIGRVEALCIPESIAYFAAQTPEGLERAWHYKFVIRDFRFDPLTEMLVDAIENTKLLESNHRGDIRWGFHFYDRDGEEVVSLYSDHFGNMVINGKSAESKGPLLKELRKYCPLCADLRLHPQN